MLFLLIPTAILLAAALIIFLITRFRPNTGFCWLVGTVAAFAVWGWTIYLHWLPESSFSLNLFNTTLGFVLDKTSWISMLASATLLLFAMLTAPSRLHPDFSTNTWDIILCAALTAIVASATDGRWSIIFCWMLFDLTVIAPLLINPRGQGNSAPLNEMVILQFGGTFLASLGLAVSEAGILLSTTAPASSLLFAACALRSGIFPLRIKKPEVNENVADEGIILKLTSLAVVFPLLARLNAAFVPDSIYQLLMLLAAASAFTCGLGALLSDSAFTKRQYMILGIAGFAFVSALRSQTTASIIWGAVILMAGGALLLYKNRSRLLDIVYLLLFLLSSGLPYAPAAGSWQGIVLQPPAFADFFLLAAYACIVIGLLEPLRSPSAHSPEPNDRWVSTVYPAGFIVPLISLGTAAYFGWNFLENLTVFWGIIPLYVIILLILTRNVWLRWTPQLPEKLVLPLELIKRIWQALIWLLSFRWLEIIVEALTFSLSLLIQFISDVFEGQGGILWKFLFLTVLLVLVIGRGI